MAIIGAFIVPHPPLILPQIGKGEEKKIQKTIESYQEIARRIAVLKPDTILITSPHSVLYADYFHISPGMNAEGTFKTFGAPDVKIFTEFDEVLAKAIASEAQAEGIPAGSLGERSKTLDHGTMVPLYFIQKSYPHFKTVRLSISGLSPLTHYQYGKCIAKAAELSGKKVVLVASGDLSHKLKADGPYGYSAEGPLFDQRVTEAFAKGDFLTLLTFGEDFCESAAECGLRSFIIMSGALDGKQIQSELLSYEGPFGVGYSVGAFSIMGEDKTRIFDKIYEKEELLRIEKIKNQESPLVALARKSLETYVKTKKQIHRPDNLPSEMISKKAGVFVSLKMDGMLRGCIGTISPVTDCIADEIIQNAVSSGVNDPRFNRVEESELPRLVYSVDVLKEAEPISSISELDVLRYGVIVRSKGRCGLLLPNLEGVDSPESQIDIALRKAGIPKQEPYSMERFEVVRYK